MMVKHAGLPALRTEAVGAACAPASQEARAELERMPAAQCRLVSEVAVSAYAHGNITTCVNDPLPNARAYPDK